MVHIQKDQVFVGHVDRLKPDCVFFSLYLHELGSDQSETSLLETLDDVSTQSPLDAIGLHCNEGSLHVCNNTHKNQ